jgi:two-component system response regulator VicR
MAASTHKVLMIDDDKFLLDMYALKFAQAGHQVKPCFSVDEALAELKGGFQPDAVVFDLVMPGKDGFDLLRTLGESKIVPNAKLIALTNQSSDEEKKKAEELGAHEYIIKATLVPSEVVTAICQVIDGSRGYKKI